MDAIRSCRLKLCSPDETHDCRDAGGRAKLPLLLTPLTYIHVGDAGSNCRVESGNYIQRNPGLRDASSGLQGSPRRWYGNETVRLSSRRCTEAADGLEFQRLDSHTQLDVVVHHRGEGIHAEISTVDRRGRFNENLLCKLDLLVIKCRQGNIEDDRFRYSAHGKLALEHG